MSVRCRSAFRPWISFLAVAIFSTAVAFADDPTIEGHWEGEIELPGQALEIMVDFDREGEGWAGTIDIPAQGGRDVPLTAITFDGKKAQFQITDTPGTPTFTGDLSEDGHELSGVFAQGGGLMPFSLTFSDDPAEAARAALADLPDLIGNALADWDAVGTSISVVADGEIVLAEGYGLRDLDKELPATGDTLYAIGSSTKAFTTFVLASLIEEGRLDWDTPVVEYLPHFALHDARATLELTPRDMVTHRSGLPRHDMLWYSAPDTSREDFVSKLAHLKPNRPLRETWQYNNLMYLTAGYLGEHLTGKSWEANVRERIFEPLGMDRSNFHTDDSKRDADHAEPYVTNDDDEPQRVEFRPLTAAGPAGSINSSVREMAQWVRLFLGRGTFEGNEVMSAPAIRELATPQMVVGGIPDEAHLGPMSYAHGWMVDAYRGNLRIHHGGNIDGFSALVTMFPREGLGIVVLTNQGGSAIPGLATSAIADRLLELETRDWFGEAAKRRDAVKAIAKQGEEDKERFRVKGTKPSRDLAAFAGEFEHPGYGTLDVEVDGKNLVARYGTIRLPLEHWNYDVFNVIDRDDADAEIIPENLRLRFQGDDRGRIRWLHAPFEPMVDPIRFERTPGKRMRDPAFLARLVGSYSLGPQRIRVRLKGDRLRVTVTGGGAFDLVATDDLEFDLEGVTGFSARFGLPDGDGPADELTFIQPNGVFTAKRMETTEDDAKDE